MEDITKTTPFKAKPKDRRHLKGSQSSVYLVMLMGKGTFREADIGRGALTFPPPTFSPPNVSTIWLLPSQAYIKSHGLTGGEMAGGAFARQKGEVCLTSH